MDEDKIVEAMARAVFEDDEIGSGADPWTWDRNPPRDWSDIEECERQAYRGNARAAWEAAKAALAEAGFKILGREPTATMVMDGWPAVNEENAGDTWRDMWDAAPATPAALAEAGIVLVPRGNMIVTNEGRTLPSEGHYLRILPQQKSNAVAAEDSVIHVSDEMIQAGLRALWDSGELEYETPSQGPLVAEIYRAMASKARSGQR